MQGIIPRGPELLGEVWTTHVMFHSEWLQVRLSGPFALGRFSATSDQRVWRGDRVCSENLADFPQSTLLRPVLWSTFSPFFSMSRI